MSFSAEAIGRAYVPEARGAGRGHGALRALDLTARLVLPVALLVALLAAAYLYGDRPAEGFASAYLTEGHLLLPLSFFCVALVNRRYGAGMALAQLLLAWGTVAALVLFDARDVANIAGRDLPAYSTMIGFGGALFAGQLFSVAVFDLTRGPRWYVAPALSWLTGGLMFVLIALPATVPDAAWNGDLGLYAGIMAGAALLMLIPYWLLRRMVPPMSGFGGY